jgi:WD40 repeat protein
MLVLGSLPARADEPKPERGNEPIAVVDLKRATPVVYEKEIEPILANKCVYCHSGSVKRNDLDLSSYEALMKGGRHGSSVVAGKSADSLLFKLAAKTARPAMPPRGEEPLTPQELALLKLWIDQGAKPPSAAREAPRIVLGNLSPAVHSVRAVAVSPDKALVAAGRANQLHLYHGTSGAHVRALSDPDGGSGRPAHAAIVEALAFSPDGRLLASGSFQEVKLWDAQTKSLKHKVAGFADRVVAMAFARDGKLLAAGGGPPSVDGDIKLIDPATGKIVADIKNGHTDTVYGLCFSPDGTKLASCGADRQVKVFEVPSGKLLKSFEGHTQHVLDIAWKADGKLLASAGADKVIKVWDCDKGEALRSFPSNKGVGAKKGGPGGSRQVSYTDEVARLAFVGTSAELVACSGDQVTVWNVETGDWTRQITGAAGYLAAVGVSPDGSVVAAGGDDGVVWLATGGDAFTKRLLPPEVSATAVNSK